MKQKLLLLLSFVMLCLGNAFAEETVQTITFKTSGSTSDGSSPKTAIADLISEGTDLVSAIPTATKVYQGRDGRGIKLGTSSAVGELTLTLATTVKPTKIVVTARQYNTSSTAVTVNDKEFTGLTSSMDEYTIDYDGNTEVSQITIKTSSSSYRAYVGSIKIYSGAAAVAGPTISGTTPFFGSTEITLACTTEGASLYYTTDGTVPTAASTAYTAAFSISESCTVKAIAIKGEDKSSVTSKAFTAGSSVASIKELNALADKTPFQFTGDAYVVANPVDSTDKATSYIYIKDATGSSLIYDYNLAGKLTVGQHIAKDWTGTVSIYNNLFEATTTSGVTATEAAAETVTYPEVELSAITTDNLNQVVTLSGVTYTTPSKGNFTITKGEASVAGYNGNKIKIAAPVDGQTYDMVGVISCYKETAQFQPIAIAKTPEVKDVELTFNDSGVDISDQVTAAIEEIEEGGDKVGDIKIALKGGSYTITESIVAPGAVEIAKADGETQEVVIDCSKLTTPMILMSTTPSVEANENGFYAIGDVKIENVKIDSLKYQLFYANKQKYLINNLVLSNSIVQINGANKKTTFDTNGGGVVGTLDIKNSTIYADPQHKGQLYSSQGGQKATDAGLETQTISIQNSTLYNVAYATNVMTHRSANQKFLTYVVKNNIALDCGKKGQFVKGINGGQGGPNPTWTIDNNSFMYTVDGAISDTGADEATGDTDEPITNTVTGVTTFKDLAAGDFTIQATSEQARLKVGDPRWLVDYETGISSVDADNEAGDGKWYTLDGVQIEKPAQQGIYIHNGKKVAVK